jgi:hypothetical protein
MKAKTIEIQAIYIYVAISNPDQTPINGAFGSGKGKLLAG